MQQSQRVEFDGASGARLAGRLELPIGRPKAVALFAHCFTCSKDSHAAFRIGRALGRRGVAVLRFDFTGLGQSEGDFASTNFSSNVGDLVSAAEFLREQIGAPSLLVGHSLGGAAVLAAASRIRECKAVATIAAPSSLEHMRGLARGKEGELASKGSIRVELGNRTLSLERQFFDDLSEQNIEKAVAELNRPLLVCHSPVDTVVSVDDARKLFVAAKHPKSFISLDDADHLLLRAEDAEYAADVIAAWAARYLPREGEAEETREPRSVVVEETGESKFAQHVVSGPHRITADEPATAGGADTGMGPYDLLLAALGACTSMTLRLYADRKKIPLGGVRVRLSHQKIHAKDCAECDTRDGRIDVIERDISLSGSLDAEQRARLLEIADKCPVHRTLRSEIIVRSKEVD